MWKAVFLGWIVFRTAVKLVGDIDQRQELRIDPESFKQKYNSLPKEITEMIQLDHIEKGRAH